MKEQPFAFLRRSGGGTWPLVGLARGDRYLSFLVTACVALLWLPFCASQWMVVVTCACGSPETGIRFMNPKGECMATLDTNQVTLPSPPTVGSANHVRF